MKLARAILLGASVVAASQHHHHHRHAHRHADKHLGSPVERRAADVTEYVAGPTETEYVMDGEVISANKVEEGLKAGLYILISESASPTPTPTPSPSTSSTSSTSTSTSTSTSSSSPTPTSTFSSSFAAEFFEKTSSSSSSVYTPPSTTSSTYVPSTSSVESTSTSYSVEASTTSTAWSSSSSSSWSSSASSSSSSSSSSTSFSGSGVDSEFLSGQVKCSEFPSTYGAVALDYLGLGGWSGIQQVPNFNWGIDNAISYIETAIAGSGSCQSKSFCSYACPAGYQKSQWPTAQGNTGQSVGGLYCNDDGYLELSNTKFNTLCIQGGGDISVQNDLGSQVSFCRTDYPGTESETIPTLATAGATVALTCPDASDYYKWENSFTSAQYYINPSGKGIEEACQWGTAGSNLGNYSPLIAGVGKTSSGTFISLFQNAPMNTDGHLDFSIEITGSTSGKCSYSGGKFYDENGEVESGCTVGVTGPASYVLKSSS
ncbi:MAG: hypothetical protein M1818_008139 [Claussenomyces sp. TS43310]|nr:MAG: hypothetical protein M1818_008139 [Claussenomyces sp. TS43310]